MKLISDEYREMNRQLHEAPRGFGASGAKHADRVVAIAHALGIKKVLDYGCGRGTLRREVGKRLRVAEYDPAVPGKDMPPGKRVDMLVCTDVLEHIEPEHVYDVLHHMRSLSERAQRRFGVGIALLLLGLACQVVGALLGS